ncbi:hypothetical protein LUZ60_000879 [Juncus effusus]|nr:hypothetical protein LUZ60_000879 [Juncus effusus]
MDILNMKASFPSLSLLLFAQLFFSQAPLTCSFSFNFPSFTTNSKEIITQGVASISDNGSIELIPTLGEPIYKVGRVLYSQAIPVWDSSGNIFNFSTHFSFTLSPSNLSSYFGDGIVFFLSPYPSIIPATTGGEYFGVFNMSTVPNTVAVEFDSYKNTILNDISEHHIGIDIEKAVSVANTDLNFTMTNGYKSDAWINYESNTQMLSVFFSYPELNKSWSLYSQVDLKKIPYTRGSGWFWSCNWGAFPMHYSFILELFLIF